jgi:hypothetical protein
VNDRVKLALLLELLNPSCLKYHHEFSHFGQCALMPPGKECSSMKLVQCEGFIGDCELTDEQYEKGGK